MGIYVFAVVSNEYQISEISNLKHSNTIKIGYSENYDNALKRILEMQTGCPYKICLLCWNEKLNREYENMFHKLLNPFRIKITKGHEWFKENMRWENAKIKYCRNGSISKWTRQIECPVFCSIIKIISNLTLKQKNALCSMMGYESLDMAFMLFFNANLKTWKNYGETQEETIQFLKNLQGLFIINQ